MLETRNLAIMFTDIKGFTELTSRQSRSETMDMIRRHRELVLPVAEEYGGKLVKTIGDAFLITFESPTNAVLAGMGIQKRLEEHNAEVPEERRIELRIAINAGEVTLTDGDVFGDAVNIASRIEGIAEAGEVYFTEAIYLAMNKQEVPSSEIGYRQLKGVPQKVKVYKVLKEEPVPIEVEEVEAAEPDRGARQEQGAGAGAAAPPPSAVPGGPAGVSSGPHGAGPEVKAAAGQAAVLAAGRAGFGIRFLALLIDMLVFGIVVGGLVDLVYPESGHEVEVKLESDGDEVTTRKRVVIKEEDEGEDGRRKVVTRERVVIGKNEVRVENGEEVVIAGEKGLIIKGKDGTITLGKDGLVLESDEGRVRIGKGGLKLKGGEGKVDVHYSSPRHSIKMMLWVIYCVVFWTLWGATPGKRALGLRVVREEQVVVAGVEGEGSDGEAMAPGTEAKIDLPRAVLRAVFYFISAIPLCLGFLWALGKSGRTWHDRVAGTRVVRVG